MVSGESLGECERRNEADGEFGEGEREEAGGGDRWARAGVDGESLSGRKVVEPEHENSHSGNDEDGGGESGDGNEQCNSTKHAIVCDGEPSQKRQRPKGSSGQGELD